MFAAEISFEEIKCPEFFLDIYTQQRDMVFALIRTRYFGFIG